jgi:hypothetical protein
LRVRAWFTDPAKPEYPLKDLELVTAVNKFRFRDAYLAGGRSAH